MSITTLLLRWRQPSLSQERAEREQYLCVELVCLLPFIALNDGADGCEVQVLNEEGLWADGQVRQKFLHVCVPQVLEDGIAILMLLRQTPLQHPMPGVMVWHYSGRSCARCLLSTTMEASSAKST
ncbi:uncharacterized protein [Miscanthus floridulus]|uniref:uncharacterized protein n=1 Tax=Miscanthus floridulus TaxID=154761 RepID=UPI003459F357